MEIFKAQMPKLVEAGLIKALIDTLLVDDAQLRQKAFDLIDSIGGKWGLKQMGKILRKNVFVVFLN